MPAVEGERRPEQKATATDTYSLLGRWLGRILATISVVKLIHSGFQIGLGPTLLLVLDHYNKLMSLLFGWLEPYLNWVLDKLGGFIALELDLQAHWREIFIVMMVYFGARLRAMASAGNQVSTSFVISLLAVGLVVALGSSIAAGAIPLSGSRELSLSMLMAACPLMGAFLFDLSENALTSTLRRDVMAKLMRRPTVTRAGVFWFLVKKVLFRFGIAALVLLSVLALGSWPASAAMVEAIASPGLAALGMLILLTAGYWLNEGRRTVPIRIEPGERWRHAFFRLGSTRVGMEIVTIIGFVVGTLLINAGLDPFGL